MADNNDSLRAQARAARDTIRHRSSAAVDARRRLLEDLDALARVVAGLYPETVRVGMAVGVMDDDWAVYVNGPAVIMGHGQVDLDVALVDPVGAIEGGEDPGTV